MRRSTERPTRKGARAIVADKKQMDTLCARVDEMHAMVRALCTKEAHREVGALNQEDAAVFLGVTVRRLKTWRTEGGGPRFKREGRGIMYPLPDLEAFLATTQRHNSDKPKAPRPDA